MTMPAQPKSQPAVQRRQHPRVDVRMSAEIRTAQGTFTATTRDLSEGGAGIEADRALTEGEELTVGLFLVLDDVETDTPPLWVKARVAWVGETDAGRQTAGVRFAVITDEQRTWLRGVLAQMIRKIL
jgi:c-di-GMP-binding flagellar brake protein YcgR